MAVVGESSFIEITCPSCSGRVWVERGEINCGIFRHATYISTGQPISPHATKEECDQLVAQRLVHGCAAPFKVRIVPGTCHTPESEGGTPEYEAVSCDYI